ncbi:MAG: flavin-dependent oxidoreductase [Alphaproteobacteria bacterium]|nr:MAG: flavin-dependent oxidoreductase [Alphaproteobacteria bacterium]
MTVLIAGGGIGGLALGLSLHQLGVPFRILEAVAAPKPLGVGINIQPHAVRELFDLGLEPLLDKVGLRTREVAYFSSQGRLIWSEPRGTWAGYRWPQFSVHRGRLQMALMEELLRRAGPEVLTTGAAVRGWREEGGGVRVALSAGRSGPPAGEVRGAVLVGADGINSTVRARLYPEEGRAHWAGVIMWRGVSRGPRFLSGRTMAMAGTKARKFVCYPIADLEDGGSLINWICDLAFPPDHDWATQNWNRPGRPEDVLPAFADWHFDWLDVPAVIAAAERIFEYPMVDRDPLPRWSFGRVTLLGDAAHAMYPIGSNGATQAIIDARVLAREIARHGPGPEALAAYEAERREKVNALVLANRADGPDRVLDLVAERAPEGFERIEEVMSATELQALADGYKRVAGFDVAELNAAPPIIGPMARPGEGAGREAGSEGRS